MADRVRDRSPDSGGDGDPFEARPPKRPERDSEDAAEPASIERRKAETEIDAGDVADDLADFA